MKNQILTELHIEKEPIFERDLLETIRSEKVSERENQICLADEIMKENHFRLDSEWKLTKSPSQTLLIILINICLAVEKMIESEGKSQASDLKTLIPKFLKREKRKGTERERESRG